VRGLQAAGGTAIAEQSATNQLPRRRYWLLALAIGIVGLAIDQATKALAITQLESTNAVQLAGGLIAFWVVRNPGAAFSMGESSTAVFTVIALLALIAVLGWVLPRLRHVGWAAAAGLLLAGIAGNLSDRLFREPGPFQGEVVDFIQLRYFAIFNVADIFITSAAVLAIWLSLITRVGLDGIRQPRSGELASDDTEQSDG
jgi:signal peptidase II